MLKAQTAKRFAMTLHVQIMMAFLFMSRLVFRKTFMVEGHHVFKACKRAKNGIKCAKITIAAAGLN